MRSGDDREGLDMEVVLRWCPVGALAQQAGRDQKLIGEKFHVARC